MRENFVSFCIGCTACLGCTEESNNSFNENLVLDFEERWLKFANGEEVLNVLGEDQVRKKLMLRNRNDARLSAKSSADLLLSLEVEAYRNLLAAAQESDRARQQAHEVEPVEDWYDHERANEEHEAWLLEERKFWNEVEQEALRPSDTPDWQALHEQQRAKDVCKSLARRAQLELKEKHSRNQRQRLVRSVHKYRACRSSRRLNDCAKDMWLCSPLVDGRDALCF